MATSAFGATPSIDSPDKLICSIAPMDDGGFRVSNLDARYGKLEVSGLDILRPVVFELGREDRHLRRVYPSISRGTMTFAATPMAEYVIYPTDGFVDRVLREVCGVAPQGLSKSRKLEALASKTADEQADRHSRRLAVEALQALLGLELSARMEYASSEGGDYRVYAGGDFKVTSTVEHSSERLTNLRFGLMAPDEWSVKPGSGSRVASLPARASATCTHTVRAPGRSELRAPVFPVIASLTFDYSGRGFTIDYPFEAKLADPFVPTLRITKAYESSIDAEISLTSMFPGREMKGISVYPWLKTDLTISPSSRSVDMVNGSGRFRIAYLPEPSTASYRALTVVMKLDEHLVRLRSVMEASLDLGSTTRGAALWLNNYGDGLVTSATKGGRACRVTVANSIGIERYMYFAASPNIPATGVTYVAVTYFDDLEGSFTLQYDSAEDAYQESPEVVKLGGTQAWKTKTFVLEGIAFEDRQNGGSDFRLVSPSGDLAVARVVLSKFLQRQAN